MDANLYKQGKYLPVSYYSNCQRGDDKKTKPDFILILPGKIKDEINKQLHYVKE